MIPISLQLINNYYDLIVLYFQNFCLILFECFIMLKYYAHRLKIKFKKKYF